MAGYEKSDRRVFGNSDRTRPWPLTKLDLKIVDGGFGENEFTDLLEVVIRSVKGDHVRIAPIRSTGTARCSCGEVIVRTKEDGVWALGKVERAKSGSLDCGQLR